MERTILIALLLNPPIERLTRRNVWGGSRTSISSCPSDSCESHRGTVRYHLRRWLPTITTHVGCRAPCPPALRQTLAHQRYWIPPRNRSRRDPFRARVGVVSRADLIERAQGSGRRIVGITAPAGFGKTTILAEWAELEDRPVAYVSFGRFDDDPARTITLLASAYSQVPGVDAALLEQGMRARQYCAVALPHLAVRARLHLARVSLALTDPSSPRHLLREINDILHRRPRLGALVEEVDAFRDEPSSLTVRARGRAPLSPAELRVLPYLQTHLTVPEIADRLYVSGNTVRTQVASIYRKLDAMTRAEAVANATEVGLLGG